MNEDITHTKTRFSSNFHFFFVGLSGLDLLGFEREIKKHEEIKGLLDKVLLVNLDDFIDCREGSYCEFKVE